MLEIIIKAPELANAINNLALAIGGKRAESANAPVNPPVPPAVTPVNGAAQPVQYSTATPAPAQTPAPPATPTVPVGRTAQVMSSATPVNAPAPNVPLAQPPQYTIDQIMAAGASLMDAGRVNDLTNLLHSFNVQAVTDLKPEYYGAFATALRNMGAKI